MLCKVFADDGAVHVWRDYDTERPSLVTAWRALTDMLPASKSKIVFLAIVL